LAELRKALRRRGDLVVCRVNRLERAFEHIVGRRRSGGEARIPEFVPPTSIAAALACYMVGGGTVGEVFRRAWPPMAVLAALAMLILVFAKELAGVAT
jgi:hypothetical protein